MLVAASLLASLLSTNAAAAAISPATTHVSHDTVKIAELKQKVAAHIHQQVATPRSLSGKIEKFTKLKSRASNLNLEKTQFDDEVLQANLRGLKMKDNFLSVSGYHDNQCTMLHAQSGGLVNYCFNEVDTQTGTKRSTITKVNLKENLAVELHYEGFDCKGIPSKVIDLSYDAPNFNGWGNCFAIDDMFFKVEYLSTYPMVGSMPGMYAERTYHTNMCSTDNMNYLEFTQAPLEMLGLPFNTCIPVDTVYYMLSPSTCATSGQLLATIYSDSLCTSQIAANYVFSNTCTPPDDDGDDDDGYDDDDNYELVDVITNTFCT